MMDVMKARIGGVRMTYHEQNMFASLCKSAKRIADALECINKKLDERSKGNSEESIDAIANAGIEQINCRTEETAESPFNVHNEPDLH